MEIEYIALGFVIPYRGLILELEYPIKVLRFVSLYQPVVVGQGPEISSLAIGVHARQDHLIKHINRS